MTWVCACFLAHQIRFSWDVYYLGFFNKFLWQRAHLHVHCIVVTTWKHWRCISYYSRLNACNFSWPSTQGVCWQLLRRHFIEMVTKILSAGALQKLYGFMGFWTSYGARILEPPFGGRVNKDICWKCFFLLQMVSFEAKIPTFPENFYPWFMAIVIGSLGVGQQFCLIG